MRNDEKIAPRGRGAERLKTSDAMKGGSIIKNRTLFHVLVLAFSMAAACIASVITTILATTAR